jgi:hypothetical protein
MSSIWNSANTAAGSSPFATTGKAPSPGGGSATKFQSMLQSSGKTGQSASAGQPQQASQPGLSPKAKFSAGSTKPMDAPSGTDNSDNQGDPAITANDFLTLLVTEMQNQDPTAQTDPNEYINQLVQINSLEQLISINQNLGYVLGTASAPAPSVVGGDAASSAPAPGAAAANAAAKGKEPFAGTVASTKAVSPVAGSPTARSVAHGNLTVPKQVPAAQKVAHSLDGRARATRPGHAMRDIPTH